MANYQIIYYGSMSFFVTKWQFTELILQKLYK